MTNYKELFETKTAEEINALYETYMYEKNTVEANKLRAAYIVYAGVDGGEYNAGLLRTFLSAEYLFIDGLKMFGKMTKPDGTPLVEYTMEEVSSLQALFELKKQLDNDNRNGIIMANEVRKAEIELLAKTDDEKFNSFMLFSAYSEYHVVDSVKQFAKLLEKKYPALTGLNEAFFTDDYPEYEDRVITLYKDHLNTPDSEAKENHRIIVKGFLFCLSGYNIYKKNYVMAYSLLEKALQVTKKEEYEYNQIGFVLNFLNKEMNK